MLSRLACLLVVVAGPAVADPASPGIHWLVSAEPAAVEVIGAPVDVVRRVAAGTAVGAEGAPVLAVYVEQDDSAGATAATLPPMAGTLRVVDGRIRLEPRFPLARGVRYRAEFRPPGGEALVSRYALPPDTTPPTTRVARVLPEADVLPENQLKFYLEFSAPMSRGRTYEHIRLREESGPVIELPFLELDEELWDPGMTRLTLLIDPGRIKRGVKPLEDIGPVFEAGRRYALSVGAGCRDAEGRPLQVGYVKTFRIGPADRTPPDPRRWRIAPPAAGTRSPLEVEFDEPLDHALALRLIGVGSETPPQPAIAGDAALAEGGRRWSFVPEKPWLRGAHRLSVATIIEDLAGNNIGKTFDVDLAAGAQRRVPGESVYVPFEVR